jgi:small-conductance mechanosensitive channel
MESLTRLIGQLGFTLILISSFVLVSDFYFSESRHDRLVRYLMTTISFIFILVIDAAYILITNSLLNGLLAPGGIVLIYIWGIFLTFLTIVSFRFRKSFL